MTRTACLFALLGLPLYACSDTGDPGAVDTVRFGSAWSEDLSDLYTSGIHHQHEQIQVDLRTDLGSVEVAFAVYDPDGEFASGGSVTAPDELVWFTPTRQGAWTVVGEATGGTIADIDDSALAEGLVVEVAPSPDCDRLEIDSLDELEYGQPGDVLPVESARLMCDDPETRVEVGQVPSFVLTAEQGAYFDGDPEKLDCLIPEEVCELTLTGNDDLWLYAHDGYLLGLDSGEAYPVEAEGRLQLPLGFPATLTAGFTKDDPTVGSSSFALEVIPTVADSSDSEVTVSVVGTDADGVGQWEYIAEASQVVASGDRYILDLAEVPVVVGAGGVIEAVVTVVSSYGIATNEVLSVEVGALERYGHTDWPLGWDSAVVPDASLDFSGPFEIRLLIQEGEEEARDGILFEASSAYSHLRLELVGDQLTLDVRAATWDGDWEEETLEATLDRLDGARIPQEVRVEVGLDSMALLVDGQVRDESATAWDFTSLVNGEVRMGAVPLLEVDAIAFLPGYPTGCIPWSTPCTSGHLSEIDGAWCVDFAEVDEGLYHSGDRFLTSFGAFVFEGDHQVLAIP
jgi:hypothetical protein